MDDPLTDSLQKSRSNLIMRRAYSFFLSMVLTDLISMSIVTSIKLVFIIRIAISDGGTS